MNDPNAEGAPKKFTTTEWSLVLAAAETDSPESREALESLCGRYWYAVYAEVRTARVRLAGEHQRNEHYNEEMSHFTPLLLNGTKRTNPGVYVVHRPDFYDVRSMRGAQAYCIFL